jgi:hypothetical protein
LLIETLPGWPPSLIAHGLTYTTPPLALSHNSAAARTRERESRALFLTPSATGMRLDGAGIRIKLRRSQNKEKSANKTNSNEKKFEQRTIDKQFNF